MNRILNNLMLLSQISSEPRGRKALLGLRPFSVTSYMLVGDLFKTCPPFKTIIDGGANIGQFARTAAEFFKDAAIWSIEPSPDTASKLRRNLRDLDRLTVLEVCIGDQDGIVKFNQQSDSQTSSVLNITGKSGDAEEAISVKICRLDSIFQNIQFERPALLKLDLQGYELAALRGAILLLERIDVIVVEVVFKEMYDEEPLFGDVDSFLRTNGFKFQRPVAFLRDDRGEIVQMDALFTRVGIS